MDESREETGFWPGAAAFLTLVAGYLCYLAFVVPRYIEIFKACRVDLPLPVKLVLASSYHVRNMWYVVLPVAALVSGGIVAAAQFSKWPRSKCIIAYLVLCLLAVAVLGGSHAAISVSMEKLRQALQRM